MRVQCKIRIDVCDLVAAHLPPVLKAGQSSNSRAQASLSLQNCPLVLFQEPQKTACEQN